MDKILIVDGNNLLFQMFYGIPTKVYNKSGETIHATLGFISCLQKIIKNYEVTKAIVIFDEDSSKERFSEYEEYKANRFTNWDNLPNDENPFNEEEKIITCLKYLNIKFLHSKEAEADDLIATICKTFENDNQIIILSFDSDFFQLINNHVSVLRYRGKNTKLYDEKLFFQEFNFNPAQYVFYKALVGDSSDNIKGIDKIGRVRGTKIVQSIASVEDLTKIPLEVISDKIRENVIKSKDIIIRNINLITLKKAKKFIESFNNQIEEFDFDFEKIRQKNSEILSLCKIFD